MDAASHLARLGTQPRPTGGAGAADARRYGADALASLGFAVSEQSFKYSKFSGRWGAPLAGFLVPAAATAVWLLRERGGLIFVYGPAAFFFIAFLLRYVANGAVLGFPWMRAEGVNVVATRGSETPRVWLVAHLDSKWQPVSMIVRVIGVALVALGIAGLAIATGFRPSLDKLMLGIVWVGGVPLMLSVVGDRNHGTLDNASGAAVVLDAAARIPTSIPIGVLLADAEELALAGARAWAERRDPAIALNCDSIDDDGPLVAMYTGRRPDEILEPLERAALNAGERLRAMRLVPGILTDSVALAEKKWRTVTLSRGTLRTLERIHTSRDTLDFMRGTGLEGAAKVLAGAAITLSN